MAKTDERNNSTLNIYGAMGPESLPDHLLPPDSPEKKKRIAQHMQEIEYIVFMEKFRMHEALITWIKNKTADDKAYYEREFFYEQELKQLFTQWQILASSNLTSEQLAKLDELRKKLDGLLARVDNKIEELTKLVQQRQQELIDIEKQLKDIRIQYGKEWVQHFDKQVGDSSVFKTIILDLSIPENMRSIEGVANFDPNFKIDASKLNKLGKEVGQKLSEGNTSESEILSLIKSMAEAMVREELNKKALQFPEKYRKQLVDLWMSSSEIKSTIDKLNTDILKNVSCNSLIKERIIEAKNLEISRSEKLHDKDLQLRLISNLEQIKSSASHSTPSIAKTNPATASFTQQVDKYESSIQAISEVLKKLDQSAEPTKAAAAAKASCAAAGKQVDAAAAQAKQTLSQGKLTDFNLESFLKGVQKFGDTFTTSLPPTSATTSKKQAPTPEPTTTPSLR